MGVTTNKYNNNPNNKTLKLSQKCKLWIRWIKISLGLSGATGSGGGGTLELNPKSKISNIFLEFKAKPFAWSQKMSTPYFTYYSKMLPHKLM